VTEHQMKDKFADWLRRQRTKGEPIYFLKIHGSKYQRNGVADYWLIVQGVSIQIEMKAANKPCKGTPLQEKELSDHARAGGYSYVANSFDACRDVVLCFLGGWGTEMIQGHLESGRLKRALQ
jgi:hypothetical protein